MLGKMRKVWGLLVLQGAPREVRQRFVREFLVPWRRGEFGEIGDGELLDKLLEFLATVDWEKVFEFIMMIIGLFMSGPEAAAAEQSRLCAINPKYRQLLNEPGA